MLIKTRNHISMIYTLLFKKNLFLKKMYIFIYLQLSEKHACSFKKPKSNVKSSTWL